jgi:inhibitor of KinA
VRHDTKINGIWELPDVRFDTHARLLYSSGDAANNSPKLGRRMKIIPASDSSLLVAFGDAISAELQDRVLGLFHALQTRKDARIRNLHPGYTSLLVDFDPLAVSHEEIATVIELLASADLLQSTDSSPVVAIPVCYDAEYGPDLADVATHTGLSIDEVIRLHSSATYRVSFLGFTAGFAYLGGMPEALHTPRLATPRRTVAAGSVGIAGSQTGVYPAETPGGWKLIGRTPLRMFDPAASQPTRVVPGDRLRFVPIDRAECDRLWQERA